MVRTKADGAGRKAAGAKAPRKALSSSGTSSSSSLASPKAGNKYGGGNVACPRPVPDWQKGISNFFPKSPMGKGKENQEPDIVEIGEGSGVGCSEGSSSSSSIDQGGDTQDVEDV
ncbi:PCNA-associated factor-like isoform X2 [Liolophura sinensis]|uniref:PCNA-associated factor-like isoform X2 n=1 Tax=Liolophura sinensis TaxID=3198878 RepID=UPI003158424D